MIDELAVDDAGTDRQRENGSGDRREATHEVGAVPAVDLCSCTRKPSSFTSCSHCEALSLGMAGAMKATRDTSTG
jgi:hypothetical protein